MISPLVELAGAAVKRVPLMCWASVCLCMLTYTATLCYVMLRSSEINVTMDGMTVQMSQVAATQDAAAGKLEEAAATIASLREEVAALTLQATEAMPPPLFLARPVDKVPDKELPQKVVEVQENLKEQAATMRAQSQQIQQQVQQRLPPLAPEGR